MRDEFHADRAMSLPLFDRAAHRQIEAQAHGRASASLMERAGAAAAERAQALAGARGAPVLVLAGPGNNGGDALVAARHLRAVGWEVQLARLAGERPYTGDAKLAWEAFTEGGGRAVADWDDSATFALVIDGLYGIGLDRPLDGRAAQWVKRINARRRREPVLALDIPSGLDAETGAVLGAAIEASETLAFLGAKPGLYTGEGPDHTGAIRIDPLGVENGVEPCAWLAAPDLFGEALAPRRATSHKGDFGRLGIVAGASGMAGAAFLCARMALFAGAGRIYVQAPGSQPPVLDWMHPELMFRTTLADMELDALVAGCGLGHSEAALAVLSSVAATPAPAVFDADALNAMANDTDLAQTVAGRSAPTVLTPHPLEAARLLDTSAAHVQADRPSAARALAERFSAVVVLKGAGTIVAAPAAPWVVNPTGNPALSTGGTGDVLAGLIGALLAQGWRPRPAAIGAAWMHGTAADRAAAAGQGPIGFTASELFTGVRQILNQLVAAHR